MKCCPPSFREKSQRCQISKTLVSQAIHVYWQERNDDGEISFQVSMYKPDNHLVSIPKQDISADP